MSIFVTVKNALVHFFTDTKTGIAIEHVGLDIITLSGFHDFYTRFRDTVKTDLAAGLTALTSPTGESVKQVIVDTIAKLETDAKGAISGGLLGAFHGSWANFLVSLVYMELKTELPALLGL